MDDYSRTVFITGASGFIGNGLTYELSKNKHYKIYAITSGRREICFPSNVSIIKINLLDDAEIINIFSGYKPDILIHLAWDQSAFDFRKSNVNFTWLEVSLKLMRVFQKAGGQRIIFAGSSAQYDDENGLRREYRFSNIKSLYGKCKDIFEDAAYYFCIQNNIRFNSCRIFTVFGEGDTHPYDAISESIQSFLHKDKFICKYPNAYRDYIHIDDLSKALVAVLESNYDGFVNIASGIPRKMRDVFSFIARMCNTEDSLFIEENMDVDILAADISILKEKIKFTCSVKFEEAITKEIEWYKSIHRSLRND
jgi:nucleoside-diphosphate-sugar epimerase